MKNDIAMRWPTERARPIAGFCLALAVGLLAPSGAAAEAPTASSADLEHRSAVHWSGFLLQLRDGADHSAIRALRSSATESRPIPSRVRAEILHAARSHPAEELRVALLHHLYWADRSALAEVVEPLARQSVSRRVRLTAIEMLSRSVTDDARLILEELAADPDGSIRAHAREALFLVAPPAARSLSNLKASLVTQGEPAERRSLLSQIGVRSGARAQAVLWEIAWDPAEPDLTVSTAIEHLDFGAETGADTFRDPHRLLADLIRRGGLEGSVEVLRNRLDLPAMEQLSP